MPVIEPEWGLRDLLEVGWGLLIVGALALVGLAVLVWALGMVGQLL